MLAGMDKCGRDIGMFDPRAVPAQDALGPVCPRHRREKPRWVGQMRTWCVAAALLFAQQAQGARIHVRSRTTLTVTVSAGPDGPQAEGRLVDARAMALSGAAVAAHFVGEFGRGSPRSVSATTDSEGRFRVLLVTDAAVPLSGEIHVEAEFAGDAAHGEARAEATADLAKAQPTLELDLPTRRWSWSAAEWTATVTARVGNQPVASAPIQLAIDGRDVLLLRTDAKGQATARLPLTAVGGLGHHQVSAGIAATEARNEAKGQDFFDLYGAIDVAVEVKAGAAGGRCGPDDFCLEGKATVAGPLHPEALPLAAVMLYGDKQVIGNLVTDGDGRFAAVLRGEALQKYAKKGSLQLVVQVAAGRPWLDDGWSDVIPLQLAAPGAWQEWVAAVSLAAALAALTIRAVWRRWRRNQAELERQDHEAGLPTDALVPSSRRGEPSLCLRGVVLHGETAQPVAAQLVLTRADTFLEVPVQDGHFEVLQVPPGSWFLHVACVDHEPLRLELEFPHDGRLNGCTLLPSSCRAVVRGTLSAALRKASGRGVDWSKETPRLVEPRWARHLRRGHLELREAVRAAERALYGRSARVETVQEVRAAITKVEEAQK